MIIDFYESQYEVLCGSCKMDAYDNPVDILIGADNKEVLQQIGEKYCTGGYSIKHLDMYESYSYRGAKYLALYERLEPFECREL